MNISGVIVQAQPERIEALTQQLNAMPGIEVHGSNNGKMVVTLEDEGDKAIADMVVDLQNMEGVLAANMVYHHSEEMEND